MRTALRLTFLTFSGAPVRRRRPMIIAPNHGSLWSALYHQNDIYPASYAAVPELISIAEARSDSGAIEALLLAASIELRRHGPAAPEIPTQVESWYADACKRASSLIIRADAFASRPDDKRRVAIAAAVFRGDFPHARRLLAEGDDSVSED